MSQQHRTDLSARLREFASAVDEATWKLLDSAPLHRGLYDMIRYHLGWSDPATPPVDGGKKLRSALCLLIAESAGGDWSRGLSSATAVDLVHNFSLIHDDIEDRSSTRRGRATVWSKWGEAQAINAGDALLMVAFQALTDVEPRLDANSALGAYRRLSTACRELTEGQFLDLDWEQRPSVSVAEYLHMIERKTGRLFECAASLGAFVSGADADREREFSDFGRRLGLAFQVADDVLGVWGSEAETGKTAALDLTTRKKALPAILALNGPESLARTRLAELFAQAGDLNPDQTSEAAELLDDLKVRTRCDEYLSDYREQALASLEAAEPGSPAIRQLVEMALPPI